MKRAFLWATVLTGATAAYLMYRRGVAPGTIFKDTLSHPVRSFAKELQNAMQEA